MTPDWLRARGEALYGGDWISPLGRAIPCSPALIHAILNGQRRLTEAKAARVRELLAERRIVIDELLAA